MQHIDQYAMQCGALTRELKERPSANWEVWNLESLTRRERSRSAICPPWAICPY